MVDTITRTARGVAPNQYVEHNVNAVVRFRSTSRIVLLSIRQDYASSDIGVGVYVDGAFREAVRPSVADGTVQVMQINLPAGDKLIEIYESTGMSFGTPVRGTWMPTIQAGDVRVASPVATRRLAMYGDSIIVGAVAVPEAQNSLMPRLRADYPGRVAAEAFNGRILGTEPDIPGLAALMVQLLFDATTRDMWLAIGTNDYAASTPLATFAARYAQLVDAVLAADPTVRVWCQSPLLRTDGAETTNNGVGATLPDYRTQVSTMCATRPRTTYVDGHALVAAGDLSGDGLHPSTAGFAVYKAAVKAAIGY